MQDASANFAAPGVGPASIRLVAVDLDGTLLNDSKQVSDQTVRALECLPQRGCKLVIASARPPRSVRHIYTGLGLDTLQINYNGALIWDETKQRPLYHRPLSGELVRRIIEDCRDLYEEILIACEIMDRWYTDREDDTFTTETGKLFKPDVVCDVGAMCAQPVTKLLLLAEPRIVARLEHFVDERYWNQVALARTDEHVLQIMHRKVSKATALEKVATYYEVPMEQVMAIGDAPNDVGMVQLAGVGVAMDNAHPLVKQAADWIAPSNNDHGVHAALRRYGLCH